MGGNGGKTALCRTRLETVDGGWGCVERERKEWDRAMALDKISHCVPRVKWDFVGAEIEIVTRQTRNCWKSLNDIPDDIDMRSGEGRSNGRDWQPITKRRRVVVKLIYRHDRPSLAMVMVVRYYHGTVDLMVSRGRPMKWKTCKRPAKRMSMGRAIEHHEEKFCSAHAEMDQKEWLSIEFLRQGILGKIVDISELDVRTRHKDILKIPKILVLSVFSLSSTLSISDWTNMRTDKFM